MSETMRLLDLFSGAGGATLGYQLAGFETVGVDSARQKHYPGEFHQSDAFEYLAEHGHEFDVIHASPPCQFYSIATTALHRDKYPDLIPQTREMLKATGKPYIIENVAGAPLIDPIILCGRMFGLTAVDDDGTILHLDRHRLFESNVKLDAQPNCRPHDRSLSVGGVYGGGRMNRAEAKYVRRGGYTPRQEIREKLMGIIGMTQKELSQAIPPAYTKYLGLQLKTVL